MIFKSNKKSNKDKIGEFIERLEENVKKKTKKSKKEFTSFEVVFIAIITLVLGLVFGCLLSICTRTVMGYKIDDNITEFISVYNSIKDNYYEKVDDNVIMNAAISGMLGSLGDEYSYFMDKDSTKSFNTSVDGKYKGIGITIRYYEDVTTIIDIFKNSPAEKAGLQVDDILYKVNDVDVTEKNSNEIVKLIAGDIGDEVKITVKRGEEIIDFSMNIAQIELESVTSEVKEENNQKVGYIQIETFAANTYEQFKNNLIEIEKSNIDSLIIDVRENTGGHLSQVNDILELFFDKKTVLYQIETKGKAKKYYSSTKEKRKYPIVVLVNSGSASASEVLTACFKENYKNATIVGTKTYGKGTVQQAASLSNGTSYKFTTQKWLTPKGNWVHKQGIEPDVEIIFDEESDEDNQMKEAIRILTEKNNQKES